MKEIRICTHQRIKFDLIFIIYPGWSENQVVTICHAYYPELSMIKVRFAVAKVLTGIRGTMQKPKGNYDGKEFDRPHRMVWDMTSQSLKTLH
jgi:hypothetical protein